MCECHLCMFQVYMVTAEARERWVAWGWNSCDPAIVGAPNRTVFLLKRTRGCAIWYPLFFIT